VPPFNFDSEEAKYLSNLWPYESATVWDIKYGAILDLGVDNFVQRALLGFEELSVWNIRKLYGARPSFKLLKWQKTTKSFLTENTKAKWPHWVFINYMDSCKIPLVCYIVHLILEGIIKNKTIL
jgi:hypothetical protein